MNHVADIRVLYRRNKQRLVATLLWLLVPSSTLPHLNLCHRMSHRVGLASDSLRQWLVWDLTRLCAWARGGLARSDDLTHWPYSVHPWRGAGAVVGGIVSAAWGHRSRVLQCCLCALETLKCCTNVKASGIIFIGIHVYERFDCCVWFMILWKCIVLLTVNPFHKVVPIVFRKIYNKDFDLSEVPSSSEAHASRILCFSWRCFGSSHNVNVLLHS